MGLLKLLVSGRGYFSHFILKPVRPIQLLSQATRQLAAGSDMKPVRSAVMMKSVQLAEDFSMAARLSGMAALKEYAGAAGNVRGEF